MTKLPLVFLLLASIAAPLRCGAATDIFGGAADNSRAQEAKAAANAPAPVESSAGQTAGNQLTLVEQETKRPDVVHFVIHHGGASHPEPSFGLWVPANLRAEYDAIPTEAEKFAWIADRFRAQLQNGDVLSGNDLGILHLYGLGVEKDWKKAQGYFVEPVKQGHFLGQRYLADLLVMSPEQPRDARLAVEVILPLLKARYWPINWAVYKANKILMKSANPDDKARANSLLPPWVEMIQTRLKSPPSEQAAREKLFEWVNTVTGALLDNPTAANCQLAESILAQWLAAEPNSVQAKIRSLGIRISQKDTQKEWTEANAFLKNSEIDESTREWAQGVRVQSGMKLSKLGTELSWSEVFESGKSAKDKNVVRKVVGVLKIVGLGTLLLLLAGLSLLTRFRRNNDVGIIFLLTWAFVSLMAELIMLGPSWAIAVYCPIALYVLWLAVTGPKALPYFVAPRRPDDSTRMIWLEIIGLCALIFFGILMLGNGYGWLYQRVTGAKLNEQAIKPFLSAAFLSRKLAIVLVVGIFVPALEEIVFRGYLHDWLRRKMPLAVAMILGSVLFGLVHGIDYALPLSFLGFACLWLRLRYRSLFPSIFLHAFNNTAATLFLYFLS